MIYRSVHFTANDIISLFLEWNETYKTFVCMNHIFFTHPSFDGHRLITYLLFRTLLWQTCLCMSLIYQNDFLKDFILFIFYILFSFLLLFWVKIHCITYKGSYNVSNISYLNSSCPVLSFTPSSLILAIVFSLVCSETIIAVAYGNFILKFLMSVHTDFHSEWSNSHYHK
jgi:hypothetical protein